MKNVDMIIKIVEDKLKIVEENRTIETDSAVKRMTQNYIWGLKYAIRILQRETKNCKNAEMMIGVFENEIEMLESTGNRSGDSIMKKDLMNQIDGLKCVLEIIKHIDETETSDIDKLIAKLNIKFEEGREFDILDTRNNLKQQRLEFVVDQLFNMITYDSEVSCIFGRQLIEVMRVIYNRTSYDYIKDDNKYLIFILVANVLNDCGMIEWGTSIRGCWFIQKDNIQFPGLDDNEVYQMEDEKDYLKLIEWFEGKDLEPEVDSKNKQKLPKGNMGLEKRE